MFGEDWFIYYSKQPIEVFEEKNIMNKDYYSPNGVHNIWKKIEKLEPKKVTT